MKRIGLRLAILFLMFLAGVASTRAYRHWFIPFRSVDCGSIGYLGGLGGFTDYESADGVPVEAAHYCFPTPEAAEMVFEKEMASASRVDERGPVFDREGTRQTGERVLGYFHYGPAGVPGFAMVMVRDGTRLYQIRSPSMRHLLAWERAYIKS